MPAQIGAPREGAPRRAALIGNRANATASLLQNFQFDYLERFRVYNFTTPNQIVIDNISLDIKNGRQQERDFLALHELPGPTS